MDDNYYIYAQLKNGVWIYERTMSTEEGANRRVKELKEKHGYIDAKWLKNETLPGAYY